MTNQETRVEALKLVMEYAEFKRKTFADKKKDMPEISLRDIVADAKVLANFIALG